MTYQEILKRVTPEFEESLALLEKDLSQMRTGQASPSLILDLKVNCFDQEFSLKQLAVVSTNSSREITVQPWDASYVEPILAALGKISFGSPVLSEKNLIRIALPPLTEEYRKSLLKILSEKLEEKRIEMRRLRERAWKELQAGEKEGVVREDDKFRGKDELDKLVKKYNEKMEEMAERRKKEIVE